MPLELFHGTLNFKDHFFQIYVFILAPLRSWWSMWAVKGWLIMTVLGTLVIS